MTEWTSVPLRSYELAKYAVQVECYVCDGPNKFDAEFCRHCHAPLCLAYECHKQKKPPAMVAMLGGAGVGKTSYLGLLTDLLSRRRAGLQMLAQGAFSVSFQVQTVAALARRRFPQATPASPEGWKWIHAELSSPARRRPLKLILADISGQAIMEEIESPGRSPSIRPMFAKSAGAMILVGLGGGQNGEAFDAVKIAETLLKTPAAAKRRTWKDRPVAFILTKGDQDDEAFDGPEDYAEQNFPELWEVSREFRRADFFAASVAVVHSAFDGFGEQIAIPMRVEPRGLTEPFEWLTQQLA